MAGSADTGREFSGKSVDEAIAEGLAALRLTRDQAEIEVVSKGSRGIFGLGSEPARVLIRRRSSAAASTSAPAAANQTVAEQPPKPATQPAAREVETPQRTEAVAPKAEEAETPSLPTATPTATPTETATASTATNAQAASTPAAAASVEADETEEAPQAAGEAVEVSDDELAAMAVELLQGLVERMGFEAEVIATWRDDDEAEDNGRHLRVDINGSDVSALIGRRGETLASLQYLVRLMVNQRVKQWKNIVVDVDQYKERRVTQLTQLAHRMADQVTQSGRAVSLEPMPPHERRIVHLALRDHATVYTQSSGEGDRRKVHIVAKD